MEYKVRTAVGIIIFNRPDKARAIYDVLNKVKPSRLYIVADGPRTVEENEKCIQTRQVFENIEWECKVFKNYSEKNLGCCIRPETGFSWILQNEEEAIFLEDDCIPCIDFFKFCDELLEKYRYDYRVMQIAGTNYLKEWSSGENSYHFARWGSIWGWATWRRAWQFYDVNIASWKDQHIKDMIKMQLGSSVYKSRSKVYDSICCNSEKISAWDHQWSYTRLINNGLTIVPAKNLVTNIGYGADATHTSNMGSTSVPALGMDFPLKHPSYVMRDIEFDNEIERIIFDVIPFQKKILRKLSRIAKQIFRKDK